MSVIFKHKSGVSGLPWWLSGKEFACKAGDSGSIPGSGRSPGGGRGNPLQVFLPGESYGQRTPGAMVLRVSKESERD